MSPFLGPVLGLAVLVFMVGALRGPGHFKCITCTLRVIRVNFPASVGAVLAVGNLTAGYLLLLNGEVGCLVCTAVVVAAFIQYYDPKKRVLTITYEFKKQHLQVNGFREMPGPLLRSFLFTSIGLVVLGCIAMFVS